MNPAAKNIPNGILRDVPSLLFCVEQEKHEQARREEAKLVKVRAIERGLATAFNVNKVIYSMNAREFRELASDFPALSRVCFHPDKKRRNNRRLVQILRDPNISPFGAVVLPMLMAAAVMIIMSIFNHHALVPESARATYTTLNDPQSALSTSGNVPH